MYTKAATTTQRSEQDKVKTRRCEEQQRMEDQHPSFRQPLGKYGSNKTIHLRTNKGKANGGLEKERPNQTYMKGQMIKNKTCP